MAAEDVAPKLNADLTGALHAWEERWSDYSAHDRPSVLYHYTDAAGFHGICTNGALWASDATFLNDSTELEYTSGVLTEVADELKADYEGELFAGAVLDLMAALVRETVRPMFDVFISCFCSEGDLLSQWRGYPASGGGYAIGFRSDALEASPGMLRRVVYDDPTQRAWLRDLLSPVCEAVHGEWTEEAIRLGADAFTEKITPLITGAIRKAAGSVGANFYDCSFSFKHSKFREEAEWRLVLLAPTDPTLRPDIPRPEVRPGANGLLPYLAPQIAHDNDGNGPIAEVIVGPSRHPTLAAKAAVRLLQSVGYEDGESMVKPSAIPLRV